MLNVPTDILFTKMMAGDEASFKILFERYSEELYRCAYYYLQSKEVAEEAVLDVFTLFWNKRKSLSHVRDLKNYLYMSVRNQSLQYLRRNHCEGMMSSYSEQTEYVPDEDSPEDQFLMEEYGILIEQAIDFLPPKCRQVFRLVMTCKYRNREIAEKLSISEKTVNEHIAKAYKRIAKYVRVRYEQKGMACELPY